MPTLPVAAPPPSVCGFNSDGTAFLAATPHGLQVCTLPAHTDRGAGCPATLADARDEHDGTSPLWRKDGTVAAVAQAGGSRVVAVLLTDHSGPAHEMGAGDSTGERVAPPAHGSSSSGHRYVHLFDAESGVLLAELYFRGARVEAIKASRRVLVVLLADALHVVDLRTLQHIRQQALYRPLHPHALLALSEEGHEGGEGTSSTTEPAGLVTRIAVPQSDRGAGDVLVLSLTARPPQGDAATSSTAAASPTAVELVYDQRARAIAAHAGPVAALDLALPGGRLLATASLRGTHVKLFDTVTGICLQVCHRGRTPARILGLALAHAGSSVAVVSARHTLHVLDTRQALRALAKGGEGSTDTAIASAPVSLRRAVRPLFEPAETVRGSGIGLGTEPRLTAPVLCRVTYSLDDGCVWVALYGRRAKTHEAASEHCTLQCFHVAARTGSAVFAGGPPRADGCDALLTLM